MVPKNTCAIRTSLIIFTVQIVFSAVSSGQGLRFNGLDCHIDERTSFTVFDNRHPTFTDLVDISFKMHVHTPHGESIT